MRTRIQTGLSIKNDEEYLEPISVKRNPYEGVDYDGGETIIFASIDAMRNAMFGSAEGRPAPLHEAIFAAAVPSYRIDRNTVTFYGLKGEPMDLEFIESARKIAAFQPIQESVCK